MTKEQIYETGAKRSSLIYTLLCSAALVAILFLLSFTPPFPPHEAEGFLVDFGFDETGFGIEEPSVVASQPASGGQVSEQAPVTQDVEESVVLPEKKTLPNKNTNTSGPKNNTNNQNQNTIDKGQIFTGNKDFEGKGTSEGNKPGTEGNMGKPDGDPNGGYGDGDGLGNNPGGSGLGHDLKGRSFVKKSLSSNSLEPGKIVFKISVDRNGYIRSAEYQRSGSTIVDAGVISHVKTQLINKQWFNAKSDAPETQTGLLTVNISMG